MTQDEFEKEMSEARWREYCSDKPNMSEDDAIRFWATELTLMPACYMTTEQVIYALTRFYKEDEDKAKEAYSRRIKENEKYQNAICDLDYLIP